MHVRNVFYFSLLLVSQVACTPTRYTLTRADDAAIRYHGRVWPSPRNEVDLISSASYAELEFFGKNCLVSLANHTSPGEHNYVAVELDNRYKGRLRVDNAVPTSFKIKARHKNRWHRLRIYKATEAQNGVVSLAAVQAVQLRSAPDSTRLRIEFIGNSITCGMGNDTRKIPCGHGSKWYDQHNAFWSYATLVGRALQADYMLSAISGAGIYRNWNSDGPTVPQQYENAYLGTDSTLRWNFSRFTPDIVAIALGTNDLSLGDGKQPRLPFDSTTFVSTYIGFVRTIYSQYPNAQLVLLSSPMVTGERGALLSRCLKAVQAAVSVQLPEKKTIKVFEYRAVRATGCSGHPNREEHALMAAQLLPFMRRVAEGLR